MKVKVILGEFVLITPDDSDEQKTHGGIIIPDGVKAANNTLKAGIIAKKGKGTPWNRMTNLHVKQRVLYPKGAGMPYEEERDGFIAKMLIVPYELIWFHT